MINEKISFEGSTGSRLSALLSLPDDHRVEAYAVFAHCFTCSKDLKAVVNISRALTAHRIGVLRFDFTGLGQSEGDFEESDFSANVGDLVAAGSYLREHHGPPSILVGHSLGGAAVLQAAGRMDAVRAVCTIGAPSDPGHVTHLFGDSLTEIQERGHAEVTLAGRRFTVTRQFVEDLEGRRMSDVIAALGRPLLIFHSPVDATVGIDNAARIYEAARHPKSFVSLDDADHLLTREEDSRYVGQVLAAWASRYLATEPTAPSREELPHQNGVTARTGSGAFRTDIWTRRHALVADEPASVGGDDVGPTPYDLLAAALGACTTMTLRMYADRKKWPLEEARVRLDHTRIHAADEERCEGAEPRLDRLTREITLEGPLDDEQRTRLMEIADRCPVHRTLSAGVEIRTTSADEPGG